MTSGLHTTHERKLRHHPPRQLPCTLPLRLPQPTDTLPRNTERMQISSHSARAGDACGPGVDRSAEAAAGAQQTYLYFYANYPATDGPHCLSSRCWGDRNVGRRGQHSMNMSGIRRKLGAGEEPPTAQCGSIVVQVGRGRSAVQRWTPPVTPALVMGRVEDHPEVKGIQGYISSWRPA